MKQYCWSHGSMMAAAPSPLRVETSAVAICIAPNPWASLPLLSPPGLCLHRDYCFFLKQFALWSLSTAGNSSVQEGCDIKMSAFCSGSTAVYLIKKQLQMRDLFYISIISGPCCMPARPPPLTVWQCSWLQEVQIPPCRSQITLLPAGVACDPSAAVPCFPQWFLL